VKEGMEIMGKYCIQDSVLALDLCEKLNLCTTMEEMSNVMNVPMSYLYTRGQQIKVVAQLYRDLSSKNFVLPGYKKTEGPKEKFEGAK
jgi:DNA polymerase delta subunit 1